ncbi:hypothetical protein N431DRAFT_501656 [Stipitochalara longipes BDJ]|nr:hypothetical protein N431DRAFT_501656 [Stipitochalara longipes BDJ]
MCGIHISISTKTFQSPSDKLRQLLCSRGPDHTGESRVVFNVHNGPSYWISAISTVLALRGDQITPQPLIDPSSGSVLCWNGEAWSIASKRITGNDGQLLFDLLMEASYTQESVPESAVSICSILHTVSGPFAFVFVDKIHNQVYFGRDRLGRRSLLYNIDSDSTSLYFSSVADPNRGPWQEVEADAIYQLSFEAGIESISSSSTEGLLSVSFASICRHLWEDHATDGAILSVGKFNKAHPSQDTPLDGRTESVQHLRRHLCESLNLRILNVPLPPRSVDGNHVRVAVLFSGGLDCTVLARMAHDILPLDQQIDLINVAFENPRVLKAAKDLTKANNKDGKFFPKTRGRSGYHPSSAVESQCPDEQSLFESCPDRETGRKAFGELQRICPTRCWRFVAVNIPYTETIAHRSNVIDLIHPHNTEMDLSIGYALYFAARGSGVAFTNFEPAPVAYTTTARVLLSGLGADELFGGYTRHATAWTRRGFTGLLDELKLDVDRLGKRNLGRDDRVISHWGREARFPYLDEALVKWAVECPIWEKCGFQSDVLVDQETPNLEPGKKVLRLLAYELGMHSVAQEKKRAIQFGARTAKMEAGNIKGTALIS